MSKPVSCHEWRVAHMSESNQAMLNWFEKEQQVLYCDDCLCTRCKKGLTGKCNSCLFCLKPSEVSRAACRLFVPRKGMKTSITALDTHVRHMKAQDLIAATNATFFPTEPIELSMEHNGSVIHVVSRANYQRHFTILNGVSLNDILENRKDDILGCE